MQTGARYQAIFELISEIFKDERPADLTINDYVRARKFIGSKDRRFITENTWNIIRNRLKLQFNAGSEEYRKVVLCYFKDENLSEELSDNPYSLKPLDEDEKVWLENLNDDVYPEYVEAECPEWIYKKIPNLDLFKSLNTAAPADFRINVKNRNSAIEKLMQEGIEAVPTRYSPIGLRVQERVHLGNCMAYQEGAIEVQDEASQLAAILADCKPEHKIIDYCCGAGGKSLAIGYLLQNKGKVLAHDIDSRRMEALKPRLKRLEVTNIEITDIIAGSDKGFDRFIIDAPCTGTGTWRRSPDAKFRLNDAFMKKLVTIQKDLLQVAYDRTKIGGEIVYITCSVLPDENENVIAEFLKENTGLEHIDMQARWETLIKAPCPYASDKYLRFSPMTSGTDGFFISILKKIA